MAPPSVAVLFARVTCDICRMPPPRTRMAPPFAFSEVSIVLVPVSPPLMTKLVSVSTPPSGTTNRRFSAECREMLQAVLPCSPHEPTTLSSRVIEMGPVPSSAMSVVRTISLMVVFATAVLSASSESTSTASALDRSSSTTDSSNSRHPARTLRPASITRGRERPSALSLPRRTRRWRAEARPRYRWLCESKQPKYYFTSSQNAVKANDCMV
mmetsp:Transcript_27264/g.48576  ORF Transcript_27264/g.48576 Transcript_27264/m.48576 type:complete len:212 (+) Transcript_27264:388-1023(+)